MFGKNKNTTSSQPGFSDSDPRIVVGGDSVVVPGWFARLRNLVWPPLASTRRRVVVVALAFLGVVMIAGASAWIVLDPMARDVDVVKKDDAASQPAKESAGGEKAPAEEPKPTEETPKTDQKPATGGGGSAGTGGGSTGGGSSGGGSTGGGGGTTSCALPNYPNAGCTGVPSGTVLSAVSGDVHITVAGTVYENKDVTGCVFVEAPNVTIRKTKIYCDFAFAVHSLTSDYSGGGLLIQDVEITCGNSSATGVAGYGYTAERVNVHSCENGFAADYDVTIRDSYIHSFYNDGSGHTDGIQMGGGSNITYQHNTIINADPSGTSAIIGDTGSFSNVLITQNLFAGGGYSLYCAISPGANYRVTDNHFSRELYSTGGFYGPWIYCQNATQVTGNVWHDTGQPV